jgi:putative FmdB family regulatory protein
MPNYDYLCETCLNEFEWVVKYSDRDKLLICPECGTENSKRVYRQVPTALKASYPDGYKRPGWADMKATARLAEIKANARNKDDRDGANKELDERGEKIKQKAGQATGQKGK